MKNILGLFITLFILHCAKSQEVTWLKNGTPEGSTFSKLVGNNLYIYGHARENLALSGRTYPNPFNDLNENLITTYLIKTNLAGNIDWVHYFKYPFPYDNQRDLLTGFVANPINNHIICPVYDRETDQIVLVEIDQNENTLNERPLNFNIYDIQITDLDMSPTGDIYMTGWHGGRDEFMVEDTTLQSEGNQGMILLKYNSDFSFSWIFTSKFSEYYSSQQAKGVSLAIDLDAVYVQGEFNTRLEGSTKLILGDTTLEGSYSEKINVPGDTRDIFLTKFLSVGDIEWVKQIGGEFHDEASSIVAKNGTIYHTGNLHQQFKDQLYSSDSSVCFIEKLNEHGKSIWKRELSVGDTSYSTICNAVSVFMNEKNVSLHGDFKGVVKIGRERLNELSAGPFLIRFSEDGQISDRLFSDGIGFTLTNMSSLGDSIYFSGNHIDRRSITFADQEVNVNNTRGILFGCYSWTNSQNDDEKPKDTLQIVLQNERIIKPGIFPNPIQDSFTVNTELDVKRVKIYDLLGNEYDEPIRISDNNFIVKSGQVAHGMYLIKIEFHGTSEVMTKKVIFN